MVPAGERSDEQGSVRLGGGTGGVHAGRATLFGGQEAGHLLCGKGGSQVLGGKGMTRGS